VGLVLDGKGHPVCCEMWPGNTTDVTTLVPIVDRLRKRFGIGRVCVVADRGMISEETIEALEKRQWLYILGARMRAQKEVRDEVLWRGGRYHVVHPSRKKAKDPSPLEVKEVRVGDRRYVVCFNEEEERKDAADRKAIVEALSKQLARGDKSLVGNKGYRRFLARDGAGFRIDRAKVRHEARFDGKWVLRTNADWDTADVALRYKQLWAVEQMFRTTKSLLSTRPIWHKRDETIRGHVFCSFLALVLRKELQDRLRTRGDGDVEWADIIRDLDALTVTEVEHHGKRFLLRSEARGVCGRVFQAAGVALPPTVRRSGAETGA
jgi:transposase